MEQLPEELILHITSFLACFDVLALNLVSKRFLDISRDNEIWRDLCFQGSSVPSRSLRHREGRYGGLIPVQEPDVSGLQQAMLSTSRSSNRNDNDDDGGPFSSLAGATSELANWDPSRPSEEVDWYQEYIARHAPLSMSWLSPGSSSPNGFISSEIRGMGLLKKDGNDTLVTPMGDGSICLWDLAHDVAGSMQRAPQAKFRSHKGILSDCDRKEFTGGYIQSSNAVECVSVDQSNGKAYFAVQSMLTEIDLTTLQVSHQRRFKDSICSLSTGGAHPDPLTVGTTKSIHIHDPRIPGLRTSSHTSLAEGFTLVDPPHEHNFSDFQRLYFGDRSPFEDIGFATVEPLPLSIAHLSYDIHVGGRFPSILTYDRRFFPLKMTSLHSGARISALATANFQNNTKHALVAAGEYKGKGSLELYPLSSGSASPPLLSAVPVKNRTSASRSKLLSVIPHGTRLLFSDLDGQLKWVERDGSTLVRRWNINNWSVYSSDEARGSVFNASADEGDVARKLLALDEGERSEVLVWTGEKVGVMQYGTKRKSTKGAEIDEADGIGDEEGLSANEERYGRMMRRALERQADEVWFVRGLGLDR